jgi:hypothetical protein
MRIGRSLTLIVAATLSGCVSNTTPVTPCCYQGAVTTATFSSLDLRTEDGKRMRLLDALAGFTAEQGLLASTLPFDEVEGQDFTFASLAPLMTIYDANHDGMLERPEIVVLYAREAMLASGTAVRHLGAETPIWAISASNADVGGLVNWVRAHRDTMNPNGRVIFRDLQRLGLELRYRPNEDSDSDDYD